MSSKTSPWVSMWSQPRSTVRTLVYSTPSLGVYLLSTTYVLQAFFFYANWWSLGLKFNHSELITISLILSPFCGIIWLYFSGLIFYVFGLIFGGKSNQRHLRTAISWSKIPYSIDLLMWFVLIFADPERVFIQDSESHSLIFINLIVFIVWIWAFILLVQGVREVQQFSLAKAFLNTLFSWIFFWIFFFFIFSLIRRLYLLY